MKKKFIILLILAAMTLSGCNLVYLNEVKSTNTSTNLEEKFNIEMGFTKKQVISALGKPSQQLDNKLIYDDLNITFEFTNQALTKVITKNKDFSLDEGIRIGTSRNEIINKLSDHHDLYEYEYFDSNWIYTYDAGGIIFAFKLEDETVNEIMIDNHSLSHLFFDQDALADQDKPINSDTLIILNSKYINHPFDREKNNELILSDDVLQYVAIGLIQDIPLPLGMTFADIQGKYGKANFITESPNYYHYWFKRFNCSIVIDKVEASIYGLYLPIELTEDEIVDQFSNVITNQTDNKIEIVVDDYKLTFRSDEQENIFDKAVLSYK